MGQQIDRVSRSFTEALHPDAHPDLHAKAKQLLERALTRHAENPTEVRVFLGVSRWTFERLRGLYFADDRRAYKADDAVGAVSPNVPTKKRQRRKKTK